MGVKPSESRGPPTRRRARSRLLTNKLPPEGICIQNSRIAGGLLPTSGHRSRRWSDGHAVDSTSLRAPSRRDIMPSHCQVGLGGRAVIRRCRAGWDSRRHDLERERPVADPLPGPGRNDDPEHGPLDAVRRRHQGGRRTRDGVRLARRIHLHRGRTERRPTPASGPPSVTVSVGDRTEHVSPASCVASSRRTGSPSTRWPPSR